MPISAKRKPLLTRRGFLLLGFSKRLPTCSPPANPTAITSISPRLADQGRRYRTNLGPEAAIPSGLFAPERPRRGRGIKARMGLCSWSGERARPACRRSRPGHDLVTLTSPAPPRLVRREWRDGFSAGRRKLRAGRARSPANCTAPAKGFLVMAPRAFIAGPRR